MWSDKEINDLNKFALDHSDNNMVHSIAEMENALAHLLNTKVDVLEKHSDQWNADEIRSYTEYLERTLKKVLLKEIVMLLLLDEKDRKPIKCPHCKDSHCKCHHKCDHKCHCHKCHGLCHCSKNYCYSRRKCQCFSW